MKSITVVQRVAEWWMKLVMIPKACDEAQVEKATKTTLHDAAKLQIHVMRENVPGDS